MLVNVVPLVFMLTLVNSGWLDRTPKYQYVRPDMHVASSSQVKFALENKYDDTGPGAKQPEYAYNTYKNLDDAIVAYLEDPDTKLPEHERNRAINKLLKVNSPYVNREPARPFLKDEFFKLIQKPQFQIQNTQGQKVFYWPEQPSGKHFYDQHAKIGKIVGLDINEASQAYQGVTKVVPIKVQKKHKGIPLSLGHYTREHDYTVAHEEFDAQPKYMYSYGVNDKVTGDSKTVQEMRDGSNVRGFYSFIDSDGKVRTVHYTADDRLGFRANVQRT